MPVAQELQGRAPHLPPRPQLEHHEAEEVRATNSLRAEAVAGLDSPISRMPAHTGL